MNAILGDITSSNIYYFLCQVCQPTRTIYIFLVIWNNVSSLVIPKRSLICLFSQLLSSSCLFCALLPAFMVMSFGPNSWLALTATTLRFGACHKLVNKIFHSVKYRSDDQSLDRQIDRSAILKQQRTVISVKFYCISRYDMKLFAHVCNKIISQLLLDVVYCWCCCCCCCYCSILSHEQQQQQAIVATDRCLISYVNIWFFHKCSFCEIISREFWQKKNKYFAIKSRRLLVALYEIKIKTKTQKNIITIDLTKDQKLMVGHHISTQYFQ